MGAALDEISPSYLRDQRIQVRLADNSPTPTAGSPLTIVCDYSNALPQGVCPPLVFEAKGPSPGSYHRRDYSTAPPTITWAPREGGVHQLTLREAAHNRWFGVLRLEVVGDVRSPE